METTIKTANAGAWTVTLTKRVFRVFNMDTREHGPERTEYLVDATRTSIGHNVFRGDVEGTEFGHESDHASLEDATRTFASVVAELS